MDEAFEKACSAAYGVPRRWFDASPGEQLRYLRGARRVSQRHLAAESGVDQAFISRLESGADARWEVWKRLFESLGYYAVLAPLPSSEDVEDFLSDGVLQRKDRAEAGRAARWG